MRARSRRSFRSRLSRRVFAVAVPTRIRSVRLLGLRRVVLELTDGRTKEVDLEPLLRGPMFDRIRLDDAAFAAVYVDPEAGTLVWPNGAGICPDVLVYDLPPA